MTRARWKDTVIAESDHTVEVEGNPYFPPAALHREYLRPSAHTSQCPWKGTAHYYDVVVGSEVNSNAAWYYPDPKPNASHIKDHVAFWKGVQVS